MKNFIVFLSISFILGSCQKELIKANQPEAISGAAFIASSNEKPIIFTYNNTSVWQLTEFDSCTNETVLINDHLTENLIKVTIGDTVYYHYTTDDAGTTGVGEISNTNYIGTGHSSDNFKAVIINGQYVLLKDEIVISRSVLVAPSSDNNLTSFQYIDLAADPLTGQTYIKRTWSVYDACR